MKLLLMKLTALALVATSGVYAIETPHALRGSSDGFSDLSTDVSADVENDAFVMETNTCGNKCKSDSDCAHGGFLQCGTCDLKYEGTQFYETCVEPAPAPAPPVPVGEDCGGQRMPSCRSGSIPMCCAPSKRKAKNGSGSYYRCVKSSGGMQAKCPGEDELDFLEVDEIDSEEVFAEVMETNTCGNKCKRDSDCHHGGFLQCGTCDLKYEGTQFYETCVESAPAPAPPAPVGEDCGGQRMPSCRSGRIPMCCPPNRRQARRGRGSRYRCVKSSGGMQARCPGEDGLDFLEIETE